MPASKPPIPITKDEVIREANDSISLALTRLGNAATSAHNKGYHRYSRLLSDMRLKVERSLSDLVEDIEKDY